MTRPTSSPSFSPDGGRLPTGPVTIRDGEAVVWEGSIVRRTPYAADRVEWKFDDMASKQWVLLEPGVHTLQVVYGGDDLYAPASSQVATVSVERRRVQAKIFTHSDHAYGYGHPVVVEVNLDFLAAPPSGTITLGDNGAPNGPPPGSTRPSSSATSRSATTPWTSSTAATSATSRPPPCPRSSPCPRCSRA